VTPYLDPIDPKKFCDYDQHTRRRSRSSFQFIGVVVDSYRRHRPPSRAEALREQSVSATDRRLQPRHALAPGPARRLRLSVPERGASAASGDGGRFVRLEPGRQCSASRHFQEAQMPHDTNASRKSIVLIPPRVRVCVSSSWAKPTGSSEKRAPFSRGTSETCWRKDERILYTDRYAKREVE
jgi:hypothetical protein